MERRNIFKYVLGGLAGLVVAKPVAAAVKEKKLVGWYSFVMLEYEREGRLEFSFYKEISESVVTALKIDAKNRGYSNIISYAVYKEIIC